MKKLSPPDHISEQTGIFYTFIFEQDLPITVYGYDNYGELSIPLATITDIDVTGEYWHYNEDIEGGHEYQGSNVKFTFSGTINEGNKHCCFTKFQCPAKSQNQAARISVNSEPCTIRSISLPYPNS